MSDLMVYFKPNRIKLILSLILFIPSWIFASISGFSSAYIALIGAIIGAYILSCILDNLIKSNFVKISIAAVVTAITIWIIIKISLHGAGGGEAICEYAHIPGDCELACREAYSNTINESGEIIQKFQDCMQSCKK